MDEDELKELMGAAINLTGDFTFRDDGYIELLLRMLGLMCDNQHFELQVKELPLSGCFALTSKS